MYGGKLWAISGWTVAVQTDLIDHDIHCVSYNKVRIQPPTQGGESESEQGVWNCSWWTDRYVLKGCLSNFSNHSTVWHRKPWGREV